MASNDGAASTLQPNIDWRQMMRHPVAPNMQHDQRKRFN